MDKVSVIIPVYNRKDTLGRCLDSVLSQTYGNVELIVVDNGSTDGSYEYAVEWGLTHTSENFQVSVMKESRRGVCTARNRGLDVATGEYCLFFDSDDVMRLDLIKKVVDGFHIHPEALVGCWRCAIHTLDGKLRIPPFNISDPWESHLIHTLLRTHGYAAPKWVFLLAGGWNESLERWNDLELGVRILKILSEYNLSYNTEKDENIKSSSAKNGESDIFLKQRLFSIDEVLTDIFSQKESITGTAFSNRAGEWEKSLGTIMKLVESLADDKRDKLIKMIEYRFVLLAAMYRKENRTDLASVLFKNTLGKVKSGRLWKTVLRGVYYYTAAGGRGAWRMARLLSFSTSNRFRGTAVFS